MQPGIVLKTCSARKKCCRTVMSGLLYGSIFVFVQKFSGFVYYTSRGFRQIVLPVIWRLKPE